MATTNNINPAESSGNLKPASASIKRTSPQRSSANSYGQKIDNPPQSEILQKQTRWDQLIYKYSCATIDYERIAKESPLKKDAKSLTRSEIAYTSALHDLLNEAASIFYNAFLKHPDSSRHKILWDNFSNKINGTKIIDPLIIAILRLANPSIQSSDRKLLFKIIFLDGPKTQNKDSQALSKRIAFHWKNQYAKYNGWGHSSGKSSSAFLSVLETGLGNSAEKVLIETLKSHLPDVLNVISKDEMNRFLSKDFTEEELIKELDTTQMEASRYPIGTQSKITATKKLNDLFAIALVKGMSMEAYQRENFRKSFPGISREDADKFYTFEDAAYSSEKTDNNLLTPDFLDFLKEKQSEYIKASLGSDKRILLGRILHGLYFLASRFLSKKEIDAVHSNLFMNGQIDNTQRIESLEALDKLNKSKTIGPYGLPREIIEILTKTGFDRLVFDNLREIIFVPDVKESGDMSVSQASGEAASKIGMVQIQFRNNDGSLVSNWEIAEVLVHEAAHVNWLKNAPDEKFLNSTPDERNAYLVGADFLEKYLSQYPVKDQKIISEICGTISYCLLAAKGANFALGFPRNLLDTNYYHLPSPAFIKSHGIATIDDFDMNNYPTNLSFILAAERMPELLKYINLDGPDLINTKELFNKIINQNARLEFHYVRHNEANNLISAEKIEGNIVDSKGKRQKLSEKELNLIEKVFPNMQKHLLSESENKAGIYPGVVFMDLISSGNNRSVSKINADGRELSAARIKAASYNFGDIEKEPSQFNINFEHRRAEINNIYPEFTKNINVIIPPDLPLKMNFNELGSIFAYTMELINNGDTGQLNKSISQSESDIIGTTAAIRLNELLESIDKTRPLTPKQKIEITTYICGTALKIIKSIIEKPSLANVLIDKLKSNDIPALEREAISLALSMFGFIKLNGGSKNPTIFADKLINYIFSIESDIINSRLSIKKLMNDLESAKIPLAQLYLVKQIYSYVETFNDKEIEACLIDAYFRSLAKFSREMKLSAACNFTFTALELYSALSLVMAEKDSKDLADKPRQ